MSAVSKSVIPSSIARCTIARVCSASLRMPKLLHPNPTAETLRPELPRLRYSTKLSDRAVQLIFLRSEEDQRTNLDTLARRRIARAGRILERRVSGEACGASIGIVAFE